MLQGFLNISPALITVNYGRIYEQTKYDPSIIEALNQENYSKQAQSLATFIYGSITLELSQVERKPIIEGMIRKYNEDLLDIDYFYKTGIETVGLKAKFSQKRLKELRYSTGPIFDLLPNTSYYKRSIEQYQQRILQICLAEDLLAKIRVELANDPLFFAVLHAIEEFEIYMWKRVMECSKCKAVNVKYVEEGTNIYYCEKCAQ